MSPEGFISICKQEHVTIFAKSTNSGKHKNFIISNNKNVYDFYSGKGKWSSTPIVFSSLDKNIIIFLHGKNRIIIIKIGRASCRERV